MIKRLEIDENYKIENVINANMINEHTVTSFGSIEKRVNFTICVEDKR